MNEISILHVNYIPSPKYLKEKKIAFQAAAVKERKIPIDFLVLNSTISRHEANLEFVKIKLPKVALLRGLFQKLFRYRYIQRAIESRPDYDIYILRYPLALGYGVTAFYSKFGKKIYTEHHTIETQEIDDFFAISTFSKIISTLEKRLRKKIMAYTRGVIGVTNEIASYAHSFKESGSRFTMSNGIRVSDILPIQRPPGVKEGELRILFIASNFSAWHGLDRLLSGLLAYTGDLLIHLDLAGNIHNRTLLQQIDKLNEGRLVKIVKHGVVLNDNLDALYQVADVGISSLAIHRNGMREACVLKTREYCARGLPFVYSYQDSDLVGDETYALKIRADESPVDIESIIQFHRNVSETDEVRQVMRKNAEEKMDWGMKFEQLYELITEDVKKG
ncbi:MAG: glycosyltransferase family 4 protein [FCB group bacterium]|nr:glycosyltransferase family 4 protein [FCB group bacterium]MBL7028473.1 glycosyltransferase family 4 protein [Candidatus Neomarinimicrobiota bacterium]MBL7121537.1 glycosyltransferase family 4 protein [Candidatus Neomarinimicrobiota bacterium]